MRKGILLLLLLCASCAPKQQPVAEPVRNGVVAPDPEVRAMLDAALDAYEQQKYAVARKKFADVIAFGWDDHLANVAKTGLYCSDLMENESFATQGRTLAEMEKWLREAGRNGHEEVWMFSFYMQKNSALQRRTREQDLRLKVLQERTKTAEQNLQQSQEENQNLRLKLEQLEQLYIEIQDKKKSIQ